MNKKISTLITLVAIGFVAILIISIFQYRLNRPTILESIPLIRRTTPTPTRVITTPTPASTLLPGISEQTNIEESVQTISDSVSFAEKNKIIDALPIRVDNFTTSNRFTTTINIFNASYDPSPTLRIEIYNINYNNPEITGPDAIAFRDSMIEVKRLIAPYGLNLKNLQIIFGNRQYIQDTASSWMSAFNLR